MSTKPHYFRIGMFVILATLLIVVAVVTFGAGLLAQNKRYFESYFDESITGLSVGSLVEFRGVRIGQVERIGFVGSTYELSRDNGRISEYEPYVRVVCSVTRGNLPELAEERSNEVLEQMIRRGLRVRVTSNILTGEAYLEVNYLDPNRFDVMKIAWQPKYTYIPSAPSEMTTIKDSIDKILYQLQEIDVGKLVATLEQVLTSIDQAVADANLADLSREARALLAEARQAVAALDTRTMNEKTQELLVSLNKAVVDANVPGLSREARELLQATRQKLAALEAERISRATEQLLASLDEAVADANVPGLSRDARDLLADLRVTAEHLTKLLAIPEGAEVNLAQVLESLGTALSRIDRLIATERPEVEIILANLREISDNLRELTESLKERPSELLFSKPPPKSEALK
jgi:paraquat-inducible protein B